MKLRSIEAFCAAVEEKSISAAARRMYLSQPSVSERLAELERETRISLLERSRYGVQLTTEGTAFYKQARKALNEVEALNSVVQNLQDKRDIKLRFAACMTVGERLLPEWLWKFKKQIPDIVPMVFMGNDPPGFEPRQEWRGSHRDRSQRRMLRPLREYAHTLR